ncbi:hypothetical protein GJV52_07505 [Neisseria brasiliensis]|nr:hypothetical protein GJV52_07505 [Neisseria brasiliensis]
MKCGYYSSKGRLKFLLVSDGLFFKQVSLLQNPSFSDGLNHETAHP